MAVLTVRLVGWIRCSTHAAVSVAACYPFAAYLRLAALQVALDGVYETVKDECGRRRP